MANDINISPDMINNLVDMLKNNNNNNNNHNNNDNSNTNSSNQNNNNSNSSIDFAEMIKNFSSNLNFNNSSNNNNTDNLNNSNTTNNPFGSLDFETILKIKSIMETLNSKDDPKSNLLYSLKPYLRKSKQVKLDQYVNLMKLSQVSNLFKHEKGDSK